MRKTFSFSVILTAALLLGGCYYKMDIQQGNVVTQDMVERLKPGMTKREVRYTLGTPLVQDPFHQSRWDYVYLLRKGREKEPQRRALTLYFDGDRLARIEREGEAAGAQRGGLTAEETIVIDDAKDAPKKKKKGLFRRIWDRVIP